MLSFIIYSNIYFSYKCGFLTIEDINKNKLVPIKEEPYKGNYSEGNSYNDYRGELLNKRKKGIQNENDILEILNINWNLLKKQLKEKNINSIQIFFNILFNDLFDLIKNSEDMSTTNQRNEFESKINLLIKNKINNFNECSKKYQMAIKEIYSEKLESKYIILENPTIIENIEKEFPYYYELLSIPLVNEDHLKENLFFY